MQFQTRICNCVVHSSNFETLLWLVFRVILFWRNVTFKIGIETRGKGLKDGRIPFVLEAQCRELTFKQHQTVKNVGRFRVLMSHISITTLLRSSRVLTFPTYIMVSVFFIKATSSFSVRRRNIFGWNQNGNGKIFW